MTLSLDDVRQKRFRMARRSGYEVLEVDEFVDEVEVTVEQLSDENEQLKQQIAVLQDTPEPVPVPDLPMADSTAPTIVVTTAAEASSAVVRLVTMSTEQAERLLAEASADADRIRAEAGTAAAEVAAAAQRRADDLDTDTAAKRSELLAGLHAERVALQASVAELRAFEQSYRGRLVEQLQDQLRMINGAAAEPADVPSLAAVSAAGAEADGAEAPQTAGSGSGTDTQSGSVFPSADPATEAERADAESDSPSQTPQLDALLRGNSDS